MTRRGVIGLLAGAATAALSGCDWIPKEDVLRYRVTVEVDTPQGLRSGSSVVESTFSEGMKWGDSPGLSHGLRGEAVAVKLPGGQTLFALLRSVANADAAAYHANLLSRALMHGAVAEPPFSRDYAGDEGGPFWKEQRLVARQAKVRLDIPPADYPMFVRFRDIRDPKSVEAVDPATLDKSFGPSVKLKRITLAVTDDEVTTGIEKQLGWLAETGKIRSTLIPNPPRLLKDASEIQLLEPHSFSTEIYK